MGDRAVVRQGPILIAAWVCTLALATPTHAADDTSKSPPPVRTTAKPPAELPIELKPYKILAWVSVDPRSRVDNVGRDSLIRNFKTMATRFVGAPWELEIAQGDGPLATQKLDDLNGEAMLPLAKGFDKAWMFRIEPAEGGGLSLAAREFDMVTANVGLLCRRPALVPADAPRAMIQLAMDIFAPVADIDKSFGKSVVLRVQGGMIPAADPAGKVVPVGAIFRPVRVFFKPDSTAVQRIDVIKNTYARVDSVEAGVAQCTVTTVLGDPFTKKIIGRARLVAIGLKPASIPTRLRFINSDNNPAAGYTLTARPAPDGSPREVGSTDREGRITLEPNFSDGLVVLRLIAADVEPLVEFPVMPGEEVEERTLKVFPQAVTVQVESQVASLRDEIVDLVALRKRLESRIKSRIEGEIWDEAKQYMDDFRSLPSKTAMEERINKLEADLLAAQKASDEAKLGKRIRTPQAQRLIGDTKSLIEAYLAEDEFKAYEDAYSRYVAQTKSNQSQTKSLVRAPSIGGGSQAGQTEVAPVGAGFKVTMPGPPTVTASKTPDSVSDIRTYRYSEPARGTFTVEYYDTPVLKEEDSASAIGSERDRAVASISGGKLLREAPVSIDGKFSGQEIEFDVPAAEGKPAGGMLTRIVVVKSRLFNISFTGLKADLRGPAALDFFNSFHLTGAASKISGTPPPAEPPAKPDAPKKDAGKGSGPKGRNPAPF